MPGLWQPNRLGEVLSYHGYYSKEVVEHVRSCPNAVRSMQAHRDRRPRLCLVGWRARSSVVARLRGPLPGGACASPPCWSERGSAGETYGSDSSSLPAASCATRDASTAGPSILASSFPAASCATRAVSTSPDAAAANVASMSVARRAPRMSPAGKPAPLALPAGTPGICRESVSPRSFAGLAVSICAGPAGSTDADRATSSAIGLMGSLGLP